MIDDLENKIVDLYAKGMSTRDIQELLYTTNIIESVNSKLRKATDGKRVFPSEESLFKSLYIVAVELERKWSRKPIAGWGREYMDSFLYYLRAGFRLW